VSSSPTDVTKVDVTMPQMGVSVAEGTVVEYKKQLGDWVERDEPIASISTDKIDTDVEAPATGRLAEIVVAVGETVDVGTVLARIATDSRPGEPHASEHEPGEEPAAVDVPAEPTVADAPGTPAAGPANGHGRRRYSPVVMRIAAEHGIDLTQVHGTGRDGRVRKQDVLAYAATEPPMHTESPYVPDTPAQRPARRPRFARPPGEDAAPRPAVEAAGADGAGARGQGPPGIRDSGPLSRMRQSIGRHMLQSLRTAATCTTVVEVDMTQVERDRAERGLTGLAYVARAAVETLHEYPQLNATLEDDTYTTYDAVHLGIAVSLADSGLIVPVIRDAQELSVEGLAARIKELAGRARAGELSPDEVRGGTFTITNPGGYGSVLATPVINQPQVAILDTEAVVKRAVVITDEHGGDSIAIRSMMYLCMSWDHRALDGALAAQFLTALRGRLESPGTLEG
jgi:pyruvate/2-oxoglutarate dehydrogenase complex dihydrolipoamide acyltransferase (E2) component